MALDDIFPDDIEYVVPPFILAADIPTGLSPEQLFRDRMARTGHDSDAVMVVVDDGRGGQALEYLNAGVGRDFGALMWADRTGYYVPGPRHNTDRIGTVEFQHPVGIPIPLYKEQKCSLDLVYEAIAEIRETRTTPTGVHWVRATNSRYGTTLGIRHH